MAFLRKFRTAIGLRKPYLGKHVHIGRHTYYVLEETVTEAKAETPVTFGNFCSISRGVLIVADVLHSPDRVSTYPLAGRLCDEGRDPPANQKPLTIGNDVWIERRALVLPGTTIGDGAVIDSLGLVSLLVAVEEKAEKVTGKSIRLLSERAMSRKNSPFLTLSSLAAWVEELIKGDESLES